MGGGVVRIRSPELARLFLNLVAHALNILARAMGRVAATGIAERHDDRHQDESDEREVEFFHKPVSG